MPNNNAKCYFMQILDRLGHVTCVRYELHILTFSCQAEIYLSHPHEKKTKKIQQKFGHVTTLLECHVAASQSHPRLYINLPSFPHKHTEAQISNRKNEPLQKPPHFFLPFYHSLLCLGPCSQIRYHKQLPLHYLGRGCARWWQAAQPRTNLDPQREPRHKNGSHMAPNWVQFRWVRAW